MKNLKHLDRKDISLIALLTAAVGMIVMGVVVCAKAVAVLFKFNNALDLYLEEHSPENRRKRMTLSDYYDEDEEVSL